MEFRTIGASDLRVSTLGLGCNNFGGRSSEEQSRAVIFRALDLGVNFFDTADVYPLNALGALWSQGVAIAWPVPANARRIPLRMKAKVVIGSIVADLIDGIPEVASSK